MDRPVLYIIAGVAALIIGYLALSFSSLEYNEYGLDYSSIWNTVDTTVYTAGIHFLGFKHSFIIFPKAVQTIEFTKSSNSNSEIISARTSDGLEVRLEISFQYILMPNNLYSLYMKYETNYSPVLIDLSIDLINKVANNYTAYNFFVNRAEIGNDMQLKLDEVLSKTVFCKVKFFQLKDVDLPDEFENAIQITEVKKQDIKKATAEQNKVKIEIETKLQKAMNNKSIILNKARGEANAVISANEGEVKAYNYTETNLIQSYAQIKEKSDMNNTGLLNYIKANIIKGYKGKHMIISID